jgi:outer membrane protein TolC
MPLFDGGVITAQINERQAEYETKKQWIRQLELKIYNEVYTSRLSLDAVRERIAVTEKSIDEAKESLRIEQEKYSLGSGTVVDVLDAQSALLQAQTNYCHALAEWNISFAQLRFYIGEGELK